MVVISLMEVRKTRGINSPLDTLLTSSIAEGSAGVPAVLIETPCWENPLYVSIERKTIKNIFFIIRIFFDKIKNFG